jgi:hypothetical protein
LLPADGGKMIRTILDLAPMWFAGIFLGLGLLKYISKSKAPSVSPETVTTSKNFSMWSVFFSIQNGKAVIFFTFILTMTSFLLFSVVTARGIVDMISG